MKAVKVRALLFCSLFAATSFSASFALGHARLKPSAGVNPRSTNAGIKSGPCGGLARVTPAMLTSGQKLTVTWEETIQHPGRFEFYFSSANDQNFTLLATVPDIQDNSATLPHQYSVELTLPSVTCTDCTLQMIQVMTENPASPSLYFSCADMQLSSTGTPPGPTPTPSPTPPPTTVPPPGPPMPADCPM